MTLDAQEKPDAKTSKRLFVGGLAADVSVKDVAARFAPFGAVTNVELSSKPGKDGSSRFAHLVIETTSSALRKCMSTYNGTKWRGHVLKIEDARPSVLSRLQRERETHEKRVVASADDTNAAQSDAPAAQPTIKISRKKMRKKAVQILDDMTPVQDDAAPEGWKKVRYGRHLPVLKLRHPIRRRIVSIDPTKYKANFRKLDMDDGRYQEVSVSSLKLELTETDEQREKLRKRGGAWLPSELAYKRSKTHAAGTDGFEEPPLPSDKKRQKRHDAASSDRKSNVDSTGADDAPEVQDQKRMRAERCALLNIAKSMFDDDDDDDMDVAAHVPVKAVVSDEDVMDEAHAKVVSFLSDDDDQAADAADEVEEVEQTSESLPQQDDVDRSQEMNDGDESGADSPGLFSDDPDSSDEEPAASLHLFDADEERVVDMDDHESDKQRDEAQKTDSSDNNSSSDDDPEPDQVSDSESDQKHLDEEKEADDDSDSDESDASSQSEPATDSNQTNAVEELPPGVAKTFEVNTNLRLMLFSSSQPFSLFGDYEKTTEDSANLFSFGKSDADATQETDNRDQPASNDAQMDVAEDAVITAAFGTSKFFFPHINQSHMAARSLFGGSPATLQIVPTHSGDNAENEKDSSEQMDAGEEYQFVSIGDIFCRTEPEDEVVRTWEGFREELTQEFKRKHRSAAKRRERMRRAK